MEELIKKLRQHMQLVWELSALDEEGLSGDDQALAEIMQMHPEYYDLWNRLVSVTDEELADIDPNPIVHVWIHQIIQNQLVTQTPPETTEILDQLVQQGLTRHEAIHKIGGVLLGDMAEMGESQQSFDNQRYVQSLRQLVRPRRRRRRRR
jgi:hypothetical protein